MVSLEKISCNKFIIVERVWTMGYNTFTLKRKSDNNFDSLVKFFEQYSGSKLVSKKLRGNNSFKIGLFVFEQYFFRNGSCASATVMVVDDGVEQIVDVVSSAGGVGLFNFSWGAEASYAKQMKTVLENEGFVLDELED